MSMKIASLVKPSHDPWWAMSDSITGESNKIKKALKVENFGDSEKSLEIIFLTTFVNSANHLD